MLITVRLGEPFWREVNEKQLTVEMPPNSTVADLLFALGERFPALRPCLEQADPSPTVFQGEDWVSPDSLLTGDAQLMIVWALAGG